jgi:hypothetical protein
MSWEHEAAHSAGVHACLASDRLNLVPVLLAWHSTLYNRRTYTQSAHTRIDCLGKGGHAQRNRLMSDIGCSFP